ncbi:hypothetical protein [Bradyrhizobium sp. WSM1253]|uniref:hypothetical protein n=1 Tax=Bradyrhizobium sp. WSM1253 TaxID=319003 RepID=UPI00055D7B38|nr:hypothetical protein [Bradyrhizobium sp. WSM1253]
MSVKLELCRFAADAQRDLGFNEDDALQGKSRKAVHTLEQRLAEVNEPRLTILMLLMRRLEKDFILRGGDRDSDSLVDLAGEFETALAQANLVPDVRSHVLELIRAYKSSFLSIADTRRSLKGNRRSWGRFTTGFTR